MRKVSSRSDSELVSMCASYWLRLASIIAIASSVSTWRLWRKKRTKYFYAERIAMRRICALRIDIAEIGWRKLDFLTIESYRLKKMLLYFLWSGSVAGHKTFQGQCVLFLIVSLSRTYDPCWLSSLLIKFWYLRNTLCRITVERQYTDRTDTSPLDRRDAFRCFNSDIVVIVLADQLYAYNVPDMGEHILRQKGQEDDIERSAYHGVKLKENRVEKEREIG